MDPDQFRGTDDSTGEQPARRCENIFDVGLRCIPIGAFYREFREAELVKRCRTAGAVATVDLERDLATVTDEGWSTSQRQSHQTEKIKGF